MALEGEALRRRVIAAAALHGLGMRELRDALEHYGANRTLAESMIRGETPVAGRNLRDLCEVLNVPPAWFTEPDLGAVVIGNGSNALREVVADLDRQVTQVLHRQQQGAEAFADVQVAVQEMQQRLATVERRLAAIRKS
jgi:DNA-binding transcriptional MerR regulator